MKNFNFKMEKQFKKNKKDSMALLIPSEQIFDYHLYIYPTIFFLILLIIQKFTSRFEPQIFNLIVKLITYLAILYFVRTKYDLIYDINDININQLKYECDHPGYTLFDKANILVSRVNTYLIRTTTLDRHLESYPMTRLIYFYKSFEETDNLTKAFNICKLVSDK